MLGYIYNPSYLEYWATYTDFPYSDLAKTIDQSKYWATNASHVICVFSVFWALYLTHNLYIELHIQTVILKHWALYVDHCSLLCFIIWAIYMFHFIHVFLIFWALYAVHFSWFFLSFLIMGFIYRPSCVWWIGSLGYICDLLPHFRGRGSYGAKNKRSPLGLWRLVATEAYCTY